MGPPRTFRLLAVLMATAIGKVRQPLSALMAAIVGTLFWVLMVLKVASRGKVPRPFATAATLPWLRLRGYAASAAGPHPGSPGRFLRPLATRKTAIIGGSILLLAVLVATVVMGKLRRPLPMITPQAGGLVLSTPQAGCVGHHVRQPARKHQFVSMVTIQRKQAWL